MCEIFPFQWAHIGGGIESGLGDVCRCDVYCWFAGAVTAATVAAVWCGDAVTGKAAERIGERKRERVHLNYSNQPHMDCRFRKRSFRVR